MAYADIPLNVDWRHQDAIALGKVASILCALLYSHYLYLTAQTNYKGGSPKLSVETICRKLGDIQDHEDHDQEQTELQDKNRLWNWYQLKANWQRAAPKDDDDQRYVLLYMHQIIVLNNESRSNEEESEEEHVNDKEEYSNSDDSGSYIWFHL